MADLAGPGRNRLGESGSLYLRQHKDQPVPWMLWGDEAFELARIADKPILLSIGYAACHWCHVMARESFDDPVTAAVMDELFVCIKVDREERPDLDRFFLTAMARLGTAVGWPLTVFLTPDGTPFGGGGYFPPESRFGLPAFRHMLRDMSDSYHRTPDGAAERGRAIVADLQSRRRGGDATISFTLLDHVARSFAEGIDPLYGGFGSLGPKFLHAAGHELLLRAWHRTGTRAYLDAAAGSVARMCDGAVFDHVGGGFHRYATDDRWRVPHFEKMLNDNGQMLRLLTLLWQATGASLFAVRAAATAAWLLRDMQLPEGYFAASIAADSGEGEGAFYLWTEPALRAALGDRAAAFLTAFEIAPDGALGNGATLIRVCDRGDWADDGAWAAEFALLRAARASHPAPLRDDKCLADWNGLAIAGLVEAGLAFDRADWVAAARAAFAGVVAILGDGFQLAHSAAAGVRGLDGLLDDFAAMALAALALHEATGEAAYLDYALGWEQRIDAAFWDEEEGGYFLTSAEAEQRIPRQKLIDETNSPSGNGLMLAVLARLHALTGRPRLRHRFEGVLRCFAGRMSRARLQAATALCHSQALDGMTQIVIAGDGADAAALRRVAVQTCVPDHVLLCIAAGAAVAADHPAYGKTARVGGAVAYVCIGPTCLPPAHSAAALAALLSARRGAP